MKSEIEQEFETIIKNCFQTVLKPLGFKKKGNNFYRKLQDLGQIVNVQKSKFNSKEHISFTINTGLFIPEFCLIFYNYQGKSVPDYPTEPECAIRQRIGKLKYNNLDKWFEIDNNSDFSKLNHELNDSVVNFIIPYFEKTKTKNNIIQLLQDKSVGLEKFTRLVIFGEYNELIKAQQEYENLKQDKYIFNNHKSTLKEYKEKYNLKD